MDWASLSLKEIKQTSTYKKIPKDYGKSKLSKAELIKLLKSFDSPAETSTSKNLYFVQVILDHKLKIPELWGPYDNIVESINIILKHLSYIFVNSDLSEKKYDDLIDYLFGQSSFYEDQHYFKIHKYTENQSGKYPAAELDELTSNIRNEIITYQEMITLGKERQKNKVSQKS